MHIWKWVKGLTVFHAPDFTPFVAFRGGGRSVWSQIGCCPKGALGFDRSRMDACRTSQHPMDHRNLSIIHILGWQLFVAAVVPMRIKKFAIEQRSGSIAVGNGHVGQLVGKLNLQ
jgi:hypothetical protein